MCVELCVAAVAAVVVLLRRRRVDWARREIETERKKKRAREKSTVLYATIQQANDRLCK